MTGQGVSPRLGYCSRRPDDEGGSTCDIQAPALFAVPNKTHYNSTGFVHCSVSRISTSRYHMSFETKDAEPVSMIANKNRLSRTTNYHMFDALRGGVDAKLSKKSGHYIGKLRLQSTGCYALYNSNKEKKQVAAFVYEVPDLLAQVRDGTPPRVMKAVIPDGKHSGTSCGSLIEQLRMGTWRQSNLVACQTRPPKFSDGQYRLNFSGRVLQASVKNFQLENERGEVLLQYGKVDEDTFHLDYRAPFTAYAAFGAALCQFDM
ncbi:hypothetical protein THAOC_31035 [Thalassiosira oceanica]|uniref:Tubby C-terminal domain-containing protein n=1 Tax=Thalassiosira oceanica TaxID=159749 RepID=K0RA46_THAOC|nr:hypothetical protein THAOC_31035 [Thalassiosira oceanica]|eukprot:EJK50035.1 hypothetical protein THAOC_31035 [Thalassiosira oceanica]